MHWRITAQIRTTNQRTAKYKHTCWRQACKKRPDSDRDTLDKVVCCAWGRGGVGSVPLTKQPTKSAFPKEHTAVTLKSFYFRRRKTHGSKGRHWLSIVLARKHVCLSAVARLWICSFSSWWIGVEFVPDLCCFVFWWRTYSIPNAVAAPIHMLGPSVWLAVQLCCAVCRCCLRFFVLHYKICSLAWRICSALACSA